MAPKHEALAGEAFDPTFLSEPWEAEKEVRTQGFDEAGCPRFMSVHMEGRVYIPVMTTDPAWFRYAVREHVRGSVIVERAVGTFSNIAHLAEVFHFKEDRIDEILSELGVVTCTRCGFWSTDISDNEEGDVCNDCEES